VVAVAARDGARPWQPSGVTGDGAGRVPERGGTTAASIMPGGRRGRAAGQAGWWLGGAAAALAVLAAAAAVVSWNAQYTMVAAVKHSSAVAALEAGIPDVGAVIFAALGVALALHGRRALRPRVLNAACIGISLAMNALAAGHGWRGLAIWVMPAAVYAVASDTLIGVVRAWVLAAQQAGGEGLADDGPTLLAALGGAALWLLRLALAPPSTLAGFRAWVVRDCPVAPALRPGHQAELAAVQRDAEQRVALAAGQRDEAAGHGAAEVRQAREEAVRARAAEATLRAELDRARTEAGRLAAQVRADAARECEAVRAAADRQISGLRAEFQGVRDDAAHVLGQLRDAAAARVAALEQARAELAARADQAHEQAGRLRAERDRLAAELAAARQPAPGHPRAGGARAARAAAGGCLTKRDQMIELAGRRRDLAAVPLAEVSGLANELAAEIGYSAGTARRELVRHVRGLQARPAAGTPSAEGKDGAR